MIVCQKILFLIILIAICHTIYAQDILKTNVNTTDNYINVYKHYCLNFNKFDKIKYSRKKIKEDIKIVKLLSLILTKRNSDSIHTILSNAKVKFETITGIYRRGTSFILKNNGYYDYKIDIDSISIGFYLKTKKPLICKYVADPTCPYFYFDLFYLKKYLLTYINFIYEVDPDSNLIYYEAYFGQASKSEMR